MLRHHQTWSIALTSGGYKTIQNNYLDAEIHEIFPQQRIMALHHESTRFFASCPSQPFPRVKHVLWRPGHRSGRVGPNRKGSKQNNCAIHVYFGLCRGPVRDQLQTRFYGFFVFFSHLHILLTFNLQYFYQRVLGEGFFSNCQQTNTEITPPSRTPQWPTSTTTQQ